MAFAASLADLQVQATCPICLDYLRDPVTIGCGHNFCHPCIQQCWEELQDFFPCPICLHHCLDRNFRRNTQLCHMTDIVKRLPIMRSKRKLKEKKLLCEKHHQILALFCEKDLELLCLQCRISPNHLGHQLMSIEQAATSHRRKLKSYIEPLRKKFEEAQRRFEMQVSKLLELKFKVENQKSELYSEFEHFLNFLEKEQGASHNRILNEEKGIVEKLTENRRQISDHRSTLNNLLSEITEKCVQADLDLLTGIGSIHNMCENLKTPKVFSYELKRESFSLPPQYFGLVNMISLFKENLTLDPKTAHHNLIISEDRKTVIYGVMAPNYPHPPEAFTFCPAVLSTEGFHTGRHFWQVAVRGTGEWSLGVCKESFPRNAMISPSPSNGCWQIQLCTSPHGTWDSVNPRQIGVFLDCELGEVSFYNLNNRSHLYTFTVMFPEKFRPYFSIPSSKSLIISIVTDEG